MCRNTAGGRGEGMDGVAVVAMDMAGARCEDEISTTVDFHVGE
jgi:hypothetical protein